MTQAANQKQEFCESFAQLVNDIYIAVPGFRARYTDLYNRWESQGYNSAGAGADKMVQSDFTGKIFDGRVLTDLDTAVGNMETLIDAIEAVMVANNIDDTLRKFEKV